MYWNKAYANDNIQNKKNRKIEKTKEGKLK